MEYALAKEVGTLPQERYYRNAQSETSDFGSFRAADALALRAGYAGESPIPRVSSRAYLQQDTRREGDHARAHAIDQIDHAIDDIKVAARDDGKNPWHTPPPQSGGNPGAPLHSAVKLLREARGDVDHGRDRPENHGLRERSVDHIDKALRELEPFL